MASPQVENGFVRIATELAKAFSRVNLSPYESRIVWFVLRMTYGWGKKLDRISFGQFVAATGIADRSVRRTVKTLIDRRVLLVEKETPFRLFYGLQKDHQQWRETRSMQTRSIETGAEETRSAEARNPVLRARENPVSGDRHKRKKDNTKDRESVRNKNRSSPSNGSDPRVKEFFDWWHGEYKSHLNDPYVFAGQKEGFQVKRLLKSYDLARLQDLARRFFESEDPWIREHGGFTIGVFSTQINKLVSTSKSQASPPPPNMTRI